MVGRALRIVAILLAAVIAVVGGYVAYVMLSYHRLPDEDLAVDPSSQAQAHVGQAYTIVTWNLGFGAYSDDYSFFMDGGTESRARSADAVSANLGHAVEVLKGLNPDFLLLQELDEDATRSWHVNEVELVKDALGYPDSYYAQNYDSPYLFYPILQPHGASKAGVLTLSACGFTRVVRRGLPVEKGFMKLLDLDRCYSKVYIPVDGGNDLCLYNLHLSAYTSDGSIATEQLKLMCADMREEYEAGNYVVGGGDFNKDLLGDSAGIFGVSGKNFSWAQPLDPGSIGQGLSLVSALDEDDPVPSCRNADSVYEPGKSFVLTVDGFLVSDNVRVHQAEVVDEGFVCSDHNPVTMTFELLDHHEEGEMTDE